jgi:hypothetical protein
MALKPLEVLHKGLKILNNRVKAKKEALQARLAERKSISSQDEHWLDHDANLVDEQQVLDALENTSDYEQGVARLGDEQKGVVRRLREAAGDLSKVVGKKRKCVSNIFPVSQMELTNERPRTCKQRTR